MSHVSVENPIVLILGCRLAVINVGGGVECDVGWCGVVVGCDGVGVRGDVDGESKNVCDDVICSSVGRLLGLMLLLVYDDILDLYDI